MRIIGILVSCLVFVYSPVSALAKLPSAAPTTTAGDLLGKMTGGQIVPFRTSRYRGVIGQTSWVTCGPAAAATLLHYLGKRKKGIPIGESEVIRAIPNFISPTSEGVADESEGVADEPASAGVSMLDLKRALAAFDVPSKGYRIDLAHLADYFRRGGVPVILHVTRPQLHYVVAVGLHEGGSGERIVLADPSFGRRTLSLEEIRVRKGFSGAVLVPTPSAVGVAVMRERQQEVLAAYALRRQRLERMREAL